MSEAIIAVDLGGTNIRAARLDHDLNILAREQTATQAERGCESIVEGIKSQIRKVWPTDGATVTAIGVSTPGPVNPNTGILIAPPNLGDCYNVPLERELHDEFGVKTYLGNDANLAALAEVALGAAKGCRHAIFITISTGIGGGVVTDGRLLLGKDGLAAEIGHMVMIADGRVSTLEKEAAGPALARQARERIEKGERSMMPDLVEGDVSRISAKIVGKAAAEGDALAVEIVRYGGRMVGLGIVTLLHVFNPEIIVIGGGVSNIGDLLFNPMREAIQKHALDPIYWQDLRIERAALGDNVSIIGAGALVVTHGGVKDIAKAIARLDAE